MVRWERGLAAGLVLGLGAVAAGCAADAGSPSTASDGPADASTEDLPPSSEPEVEAAPASCPAGEPLIGCVESTRLADDMATMAQPRVAGMPHHLTVQDLCAARLQTLGYTVERHDYGSGTNVLGKLAGTTQPDHQVVLGAHYDSVESCSGADDNASGVAGILEAARILATVEHDRTLVIACWDEEELGMVGSNAWVRRSVATGERTVLSFNLDMIGYYSDEPDSQVLPDELEFAFPEEAQRFVDNGRRADFISLLGNEAATAHVEHLEASAATLGMPTFAIVVPELLLDLEFVADLRRSDHSPFWDEAVPTVMLSDTGELRNALYHCIDGDDALETVDVVRAGHVVGAVVDTAVDALAAGDADEGSTGRPPECGLGGPDCIAGDKCNLTINGIGRWIGQCFPRAAAPVPKGASCLRPGDTPGEDDCAEGLWCATWGVAEADPPQRRCHTLCTADADCGTDERCAQPHPTSHRIGVCLEICDPFGDDCAAGLACRYWKTGFEDGAPISACHWAGNAPAGADCNVDAATDCMPGLSCVISPIDGAAGCRAWCDADHPCGNGLACIPDRNQPPDGPDGFCQPE